MVLYSCSLKFGVKLIVEARWKKCFSLSSNMMCSVMLHESRALLVYGLIFIFLRFGTKLIVDGFSFSFFWDNIQVSPHQKNSVLCTPIYNVLFFSGGS